MSEVNSQTYLNFTGSFVPERDINGNLLSVTSSDTVLNDSTQFFEVNSSEFTSSYEQQTIDKTFSELIFDEQAAQPPPPGMVIVSQSFIVGLEEQIIDLESEKIAALSQVEDLNILTGSLYEEIEQLYDYINELLAGGGSTVKITTTQLPNAVVGTPYSKTLAANGGLTPYDWSIIEGNLPAGLTLNATTGKISGTPTAVFNDFIKFKVADSSPVPQTDTESLRLIVNPAPLPRNVNVTLRNQNTGGITAGVKTQMIDIESNGVSVTGTGFKEGQLVAGITQIKVAQNITYSFNECVLSLKINLNGTETEITQSNTKVFTVETFPTDDLSVIVKYSQAIIP